MVRLEVEGFHVTNAASVVVLVMYMIETSVGDQI